MPENAGLENTLAAFRRSIALGCSWIETDVHASRDGIVYLAHDADLRRIAGVDARIDHLDAVDLDRILVGGQEPLPRLATVLEAFPQIGFNIDVKAPAAVPPLIRLLRRLSHPGGIRLASFDTGRLQALRRALPGILTSISQGELLRLLVPGAARGLRLGPDVDAAQIPDAHRGIAIATERTVERLHRAGLAVHVWTVDDPGRMRALLDVGIDGIVTDRPELALGVTRERVDYT